jgi:hypothetical protein
MIQYSNINDAWGNKDLLKKNSLNNLNNKSIESNLEVLKPNVPIAPKLPEINPEKNTPQISIEKELKPVVQNSLFDQLAPFNKEHFFQESKPCSFANHLKNCEHCRNSLTEYLSNESTTSTIDLFGLKITISKDILKIIFVILIICIFIILLSMVNISFKNDMNSNMRYFMKYDMMPPQIPFYRPY